MDIFFILENVSVSLDVEVKITNREYEESYANKSSVEYQNLENEFKEQVKSQSPCIMS